jgi:hypothetical protein
MINRPISIIGALLLLAGLYGEFALAIMGAPTPGGSLGSPTPLQPGAQMHVWVEIYEESATFYEVYCEIDKYNDGTVDAKLPLNNEGQVYKGVFKWGAIWTVPPQEAKDYLIRFRFFARTRSGDVEKTAYGIVYGTGSPPPEVSIPTINWTYPNGSRSSPNIWPLSYNASLQISVSDTYPVFVTIYIDLGADGTIDRTIYPNKESESFFRGIWQAPDSETIIKFTFEVKNTLGAQATATAYAQTSKNAPPLNPPSPDNPPSAPPSTAWLKKNAMSLIFIGVALLVVGLLIKR